MRKVIRALLTQPRVGVGKGLKGRRDFLIGTDSFLIFPRTPAPKLRRSLPEAYQRTPPVSPGSKACRLVPKIGTRYIGESPKLQA